MAEVKIKDLRDWLREVEKLGEVKHVTQTVDPKLEMSAITYLNGLTPGHPTLLFENPKGFSGDVKVLFNPIGGSLNRLSLALRLSPGRTPMQLVEYLKDAFLTKIPPVTVDPKDAPIYENVLEGAAVDLFSLPVPMHWPRDGGPYIGTADAIITKDPESGRINMGTYRQMLQEKNVVGYNCNPGSDTAHDRNKWWAMGKPCPVVSVYGVDPLLFAYAAQRFPSQESEYDYAGGINGAPIEVVPGKYTGLPIPAGAELAVEGYSYPNQGRREGPFGEYSGYYGRPAEDGIPCIEVKALYFRNQPIMTAALMAEKPGANDQSLFWGMMRGAKIWNDLEVGGISGVKGVWCPPAAAMGAHMTVVSMQQQYPGHAQQVGALAAQCAAGACWCKFIVVVDEDVDPSDLEQVIWAIATRCSAVDDIDILRNTWSSMLDPSLPPETRAFGSKALIFACKDFRRYKEFTKRTALTKEIYKQVSVRWQELGFSGKAPVPRLFDDMK